MGNNMFAYCGNNPVNCKDTEGTLAGLIIGGVIGAVTGALSAKASGQSVLFGAVIGGLAGVAAGTVGLFVAAISNTALAIGVSTAANALIGAGSSAFNQYVNYRLQDKAKRENVGTGYAITGQGQAVADAAYNAESFSEYFSWMDVAEASVWGGVGGYLGGKLSCGGNQTISFSPPSGLEEVSNLAMSALASVGPPLIQVLIDPIVSPQP